MSTDCRSASSRRLCFAFTSSSAAGTRTQGGLYSVSTSDAMPTRVVCRLRGVADITCTSGIVHGVQHDQSRLLWMPQAGC